MNPNTLSRQKCATCRYFNAQALIHAIDAGQGRCHRYPPVFSEPASGEKSHHWQFPIVHVDNWCGEHQAAQPAD